MPRSKDKIVTEASAFINSPESILQVLASKNFNELHGSWSNSLIVSFQKYFLKTQQLDKEVKEKKRNLIYGVFTNVLFFISSYLFLYDSEEYIETLKSFLLIYLPYYVSFMFFSYTLLKLKIINFSSIALKELSLITAISFDNFFKNDQTKEQYNKLNDLDSIEKYEDHRRYLEITLTEIAKSFVFETNLSTTIKLRCIKNLVVYQKELLKQFDSRAFLHDNYNNIFKHSEHSFK